MQSRSSSGTRCVVVVRHAIKPGKYDYARQRIESNGVRMAEAQGFVSRILVHPYGQTDELATVTVWDSKQSYDTWVEQNRKANVHRDAESPYVGSPDTRVFEAISGLGSF